MPFEPSSPKSYCELPSCSHGKIGGWNYQFKDGPCAAAPCLWKGSTRPHFTDTPSRPIVDAGKAALEEQIRERATFSTGEWVSEMGDIVYDD